MRQAGGGEETSSPCCEQSHHHTLWDQTLGFVLHSRSQGTTVMGVPGGSCGAATAQTPTLPQQETRPSPVLCELTEKEKPFLKSF